MTDLDVTFLMEHNNEIENEYQGKYIAVHEDHIIASGKTIHEIYEAVDKIGVEDPLITYVPEPGEEILLI
ncbi:MAG: hypothetical protein KAJ51_06575 [Thermoplasmata archaeon]|nr:hypothetical protein [Thermoplasmata archaeon]